MQEVIHNQNIYETLNKTVQITPELCKYHVLGLNLTNMKKVEAGS